MGSFPSGKLISLSGVDGAGKSLQAALLAEFFQREWDMRCTAVADVYPSKQFRRADDLRSCFARLQSYDVVTTRFYLSSKWHYDLMMRVIYGSLGDPALGERGIRTVARLAERDRRLWDEYVLSPLLHAGKILISDRYVFDEVAYRMIDYPNLAWLRGLFSGAPRPDLALLLRVTADTARERNRHRSDAMTSIIRRTERLESLISALDLVAEQYELTVLNAEKDSTTLAIEIHNQVRSAL